MKREIKFRGRLIDNGEWVYGNYIEKDHPQYAEPTFWASLIHDRALTAVEVDPETVGQYTGLKDKNGKEVYEGDILKGGIYKSFFVEWDFEENGWNITEYGARSFEVIGNIYKNPELLQP
jgi:uncharacterized phage protein (TIGR01671 family)